MFYHRRKHWFAALSVAFVFLPIPHLLSAQPSSASTTLPPATTTTISAATTTTSTINLGLDKNTLSYRYARQDITSSTIEELAERLRSLSLSDKGSREELRQRLVDYYGLPTTTTTSTTVPAGQSPTSGSPMVVTIDSAGAAEYLSTDTVSGKENVMRLSGGVLLTINDASKGTKHKIRADEVTYNKQKESMSARGKVEYILTENGKDQTFTGDEMNFSLKDSEGRFLDGLMQKEQIVKGAPLKFRIQGFEISRNGQNLVVLDKPNMTSSVFDIPAYHIEASKIWSLTPGEWAVANATLFVGRIPMFYFPFFYYPPDDMFVHPVIGFRTVEGAFLQTTTYILGRKPQGDKNTLSFMQFDSGLTDDNSELRPHGLYLQKVAKSKATVLDPQAPRSGQYIKILADYYSQLGALIGIQGNLKSEIFSTFNFGAHVGFSRAVYQGLNGAYTNFLVTGDAPNQKAVDRWDAGYIGGAWVPFRFTVDLDLGFSLSGFIFKVRFPFASDPFFNKNFLTDRKEDINWSKLIGIDKDTTSAATTISASSLLAEDPKQIGLSFEGTFRTPMFGQWLQDIRVDRLNANLNWTKAANIDQSKLPLEVTRAFWSANKSFYLPGTVTLPEAQIKFSGTLIQYPPYVQQAIPGAVGSPTQAVGRIIAGLIAPWEEGPSLPVGAIVPNNPQGTAAPFLVSVFDLKQPYKNPAVNPDVLQKEFAYSLAYTVTPSLFLDSRFAGIRARELTNISWGTDYWRLQQTINSKLIQKLTFPLGLGSIDVTFGAEAIQHTLPQKPTVTQIDASDLDPNKLTQVESDVITGNAERGRSGTLSMDEAKLTLTPFAGTGVLNATKFEYDVGFRFYKMSVKAKDITANSENIQIEDFLEWNRDRFIRHSAKATIDLNLAPLTWNIGATYTLPPLARSIAFTTGLNLGKASLTANETVTIPDSDAAPTIGDLTALLNLPLFDWLTTFSTNAVFNLNDQNLRSLTQTIGLFGFTVSVTGKYVPEESILLPDLSINPGGWQAIEGTTDFRLTDGSLGYKLNWVSDPFWKNRVIAKFGTDLNYSQNFIQVNTLSTLTYTFSAGLKIQEFLDLTFSATGANSRMFRYFPDLNRKVDPAGVSGRLFFEDLADSFKIFESDNASRIKSYFDLSEITVGATHSLGDWTIGATYTGRPKADINAKIYKWDTVFSITIAWVPIPEITSKITLENDGLTVK